MCIYPEKEKGLNLATIKGSSNWRASFAVSLLLTNADSGSGCAARSVSPNKFSFNL